MTVHIFMANLAYAIRRRETVTIGGGEFDWTELAKVAQFMEEAVTKVAPKPGFSRARTLLWDLPIYDKKSAEAFLRLLDANGLAFHPDDDPADVVGPSSLPLFNLDEAMLLRQRMAEVRMHHDDPPVPYF